MSDDRVFDTGAVRDNADGKGRMDLLPWNAIIELSKHCERGAKHYGENNVRKGIPFHSLSDSGARHLAKWIAGITDEPTHLVAACWNLMWLLEETITRPELNDMAWAKLNDMARVKHEVTAIDFSMDIDNPGRYQTADGVWHEGMIISEHPDDTADREKKITEAGN